MDLPAIMTAQFMGVALVFARIGAIAMFVPGFGETFFPVRHRLALALVLSLALMPALPVGAVEFEKVAPAIGALAIEVTLGLWVGITARVLMTALQFAGYQVGLIAGLSNAFAPNIGSFQGSTLISTGLMLGGIAVIFAADLHHLIIAAMILSYDVFPAGLIMAGDLSEQIVRTVAYSFYLGLSIAAPFYVMGILLNLGLGLANRMMPNLPVFFVAAPVLIAAGLFVLIAVTPFMLREFVERFAEWLGLLMI